MEYTKPKYILTDADFVIQELGSDGNYHMVARVAHRRVNDDVGKRLVEALNRDAEASTADERTPKSLSWDELGLDESVIPTVQKWLDRGDGIAVYENQDMGHPELGHRQFVSYGSINAQLETDDPPERLPDIGSTINWRYTLVGVFDYGTRGQR